MYVTLTLTFVYILCDHCVGQGFQNFFRGIIVLREKLLEAVFKLASDWTSYKQLDFVWRNGFVSSTDQSFDMKIRKTPQA